MTQTSKKVRLSQAGPRSVRLAFLAALLGVSACASLLGIEDLHESPAADAGASGSSSGAGNGTAEGGKSNPSGGASADGGANPMTGDAGQAPGGGASVAGAGGASGASGGASGASGGSGGGSAGSSGASGAAGAGAGVHGHVIDFWGHALGAVPVQIGEALVKTDQDGAFAVDSATAQYDASLVVSYTDNGRLKTRGWVYQGLTRRDPTLQVYDGLATVSASLDIKPNSPATLTDVRTLTVALGGTDVSQTNYDVSGAGTDGTSVDWQGPATTQTTAHALIWEKGGDGFPAKFIAYDTQSVALSSLLATHAQASFALTADTIAVGNIAGTIAGASFTDRSNSVFLRFASGAVMQLLSEQPTTASFTYVVPSIATVTATVAASQGDVNTEYAIAHKDGLLPGAAPINLAIPTPAKALAVSPGADVDKVSATTQFTFMAGGSTAPFVAVLTSGDPFTSDDSLYVVSSKAPFTLPKVVGGMYTLKAGASYIFRVETHGAPASVDAMAGSTGFLDAFSASDFGDTPSGPRSGDGSYTLSSVLNFKVAP